MNRDEVPFTNVRIAELMNVRHSCAGHFTAKTFARGLVTKTTLRIVMKDCLPKNAFVNFDRAVRAVVVVNRRPMARAPTQNEHLRELILADPMTPIVSFFETNVWLHFFRRDLNFLKPRIQLFERRWISQGFQRLNQLGERKRFGRGG